MFSGDSGSLKPGCLTPYLRRTLSGGSGPVNGGPSANIFRGRRRSADLPRPLSNRPHLMCSIPYDASAIEVLTGLEPGRKRPGMYTFTDRPDRLPQEGIDNAADEAIAGYCREITVTLYQDGSLAVADDGRGMPVDRHSGET